MVMFPAGGLAEGRGGLTFVTHAVRNLRVVAEIGPVAANGEHPIS